MKARKLASLATSAVRFAVVGWVVWSEVKAFEDFRSNNSGAGVWAFVADRAPLYLLTVLFVAAIFGLAVWLVNLPATDADNTEFHEKETS